MARVDGSLRSLLQGVSQQPLRDRLSGQATAQINMSSDPVTGLTRRPPTDLVNILLTSTTVKAWHNFQTKNGSKFIAVIDGSAVKVWDYNGTSKTVTMSGGTAYLNDSGPYAFGVVEDTLYVVNKSRKPAMLSTTQTYYNRQASLTAGLISIFGGEYGATYTVSLNGAVAATYLTPASAAGAEKYQNADDIAIQIATTLKAAAGSVAYQSSGNRTSTGLMTGSQWVVSTYNGEVLVTNTSGTVFTLTMDDGRGNTLGKCMTDSVKDPVDLPARAPHGYAVRVSKHTDPAKDTWLEFTLKGAGPFTLGQGFGNEGFWQECVADATPYIIDDTTMPCKLVYDSVAGTFAFNKGVWQNRRAGTTVSNEDPSFIANTINDVFTFQNRLGFLAGSNLILSRTDHQDDFWFESVQQKADTDPIDITSTAVEASIMTAVVPNNKDLIIFSREGQFLLSGRAAVTPDNAALTLTTAFEAELNAHPVTGGANVYFANNFGMFTGMREFFAQGNSDNNDSRSITQHVNKYILGKATKLTSSSNYNMLLVHTDQTLNTFYPYQYIWNDTQKIQSAWSTWILNRDVAYSFFDEEILYFVVLKSNEYCLYRMSLDVQPSDGLSYAVFLDGRFDVPGCHTSFILPDILQHDETIIAVQGLGCPNPGLRAEILSVAFSSPNWVVTLKRDMDGGNVIVGTTYRSSYKPSMPLVKDSDNVAVGTGKLKVSKFLVSVENTGGMQSQTSSSWGAQEPVEFTARFMTAVDNLVGQQPLYSGTFKVPFRAETTKAELEIWTDDHLPLTLIDIEWVGQYNKRGRRISLGGGQGATNIGSR